MSTCIIYKYINCSPCVNCLEDRLELKRRTEVNISKSVTRKSTQLTVFIIDSTSASLETSPPKVMAWPPDASICKTEEYQSACRIKQDMNRKGNIWALLNTMVFSVWTVYFLTELKNPTDTKPQWINFTISCQNLRYLGIIYSGKFTHFIHSFSIQAVFP